jgi:DNA-binding phage protein
MPLTRSFRDTVLTRARRSATFRRALLTEAVNELLAGDLETGKAILRDYINATITFEGLARALNKPNKSLQRMLGSKGNPTAENIFAILRALQDHEALRLKVTAKRPAA